MSDRGLTLAELVDLEARVAADQALDPEALRERDRKLHAALAPQGEGRAALLVAWLEALGAERPRLGERVARAHRLLGALLVVLGLGMGWSAAALVLHFDGTRPVNVAAALAVLVLLQLALLLLLGLGAALRRIWPDLADRVPLLGDLRDLLRWAIAAVSRTRGPTDTEAAWRRLRSRRSLYRGVERWLLVGLLQRFGVAFNLGALACFAWLVTFSDLAFGWSTTLSLEAGSFGGGVRALAAPWGWFWPDAVPSAELVEATRYSRLEAAYAGASGGRAVDPGLVGGWWRFLFAALTVYGLVPRVALLVAAERAAGRALRTLPLDTPDVDGVVRRLTVARVETAALAPEAHRPIESAGPHEHTPERTDRCVVVLWRDVPLSKAAVARYARDRFGASPEVSLAVGDYEAEGRAVGLLGEGRHPVLVVAEAWEAPDKAVRRFLKRAREGGPRDRPIVLGLVGEASGDDWTPADPAQVRVWRRHLALLEDPYLAVEAVS